MRLGLVGTGLMAPRHAEAFGAREKVTLAAAIDIDRDAAMLFAEGHGFEAAYGSLEEAFDAAELDALAIVTPDSTHFSLAMAALERGLHVFCEKPLATNAADAARMREKAERMGVVHGVNLTYRNVAAVRRTREMIAAGEIGEVRHFSAAYLQSWLTQPAWGDWRTSPEWLWRLSEGHGSKGVLGDVGIHILDFLTFAAGRDIATLTAQHRVFDKSETGRIGEYVLDANDSVAMTVGLEGGALGVVHATRFASGHVNDLDLHIFGDRGGIEVTNRGALGTLRVSSGAAMETGTWLDVPLDPVETNYRRFVSAIGGGAPMDPDFGQGAKLQSVLDLAHDLGRASGVPLST